MSKLANCRAQLGRRLGRGPGLHDERGVSLIEVVVSAGLVLTVAGAVLGSIDGASRTSGRTAATATAADLAQQDLERLRSLPIVDLANLYQERSVTVRNVAFTVKSTGSFVSESTRTPGCTATATANYVRITSTAQAPILREPVSMTSLVSPAVGSLGSNTGGMVVQIRDAAGRPVRGVAVSIAGPGRYRQPTSEEGCAFFAYVPTGAYSATYSAAGFVDQGGRQDVTLPTSVSADRVQSYQTTYDKAGSITAEIETRVDGVARRDEADALSLTHPNLPGSGARLTTPDPAPADTVAASSLFPFTSPYGLYSGSCASNALPAPLVAQLPAGAYATQQLVAPGAGYDVRVFEPAVPVTVTQSGRPVEGARVVYTQASAECPTVVRQTTDAAGEVPHPGLPYGTWDVCADAVLPARGIRSSVVQRGVVNDQVDGRRITLPIPDRTTESKCA